MWYRGPSLVLWDDLEGGIRGEEGGSEGRGHMDNYG